MNKNRIEIACPESKYFQAETFDWLYDSASKKMIIHLHSSHYKVEQNDYYIIFEEVKSFDFNEYTYFKERVQLKSEDSNGILHKQTAAHPEEYNTYISFQVPFVSTLEIVAKSFKIH